MLTDEPTFYSYSFYVENRKKSFIHPSMCDKSCQECSLGLWTCELKLSLLVNNDTFNHFQASHSLNANSIDICLCFQWLKIFEYFNSELILNAHSPNTIR